MNSIKVPRRFLLIRTEDISGVSGTGVVASGVVFGNGKAVMAWDGKSHVSSVAVYDSIDDLVAIHGHGGVSTVRWIDDAAEE